MTLTTVGLALLGSALAACAAYIPWAGATMVERAYNTNFNNPTDVVNGDGLGGVWPNQTHGTSENTMWFAAAPFDDDYIEFNLAQVYEIEKIHVWNGNQAAEPDRSTRQVDILVSEDGLTYTTVITNMEFAQAPCDPSYTGFDVNFPAGTRARLIRIEIDTNWGDGNYTALSEVQFYGTLVTQAVPNVISFETNIMPVWVSTEYDSGSGRHVFNGTGLSGALPLKYHTQTRTGNMWIKSSGGSVPGQWIQIGLTHLCDVEKLHIWNMCEANYTTRSIKRAQLSTSLDGQTFTNVFADITFPQAWDTPLYQGLDLAFPSTRRLRYIRVTVLENYGDGYVGLAEVEVQGRIKRPFTLYTNTIIATASSYYSPDGRTPTNTVNGTGLTDTRHNNTYTHMWLSNAEVLPWIKFDLGNKPLVGLIRIWNYNEGTVRGIKRAKIEVSDNDSDWTTLYADVSLSQSTGANNLPPDDLVLAQPEKFRYVLVTTLENWGGSYTGLSEVQFLTTVSANRGSVFRTR